MKRLYPYILAAVLLCVCSCAKEIGVPTCGSHSDVALSLSAPDVKTTLDDKTLKVSWTAGDTILIWAKNTPATMPMVAKTSGTSSEFSGVIGDIDFSERLYALYPSSSVFMQSSGYTGIVVKNHSVQTGLLSDFGKYNFCYSAELSKTEEDGIVSLSCAKALSSLYAVLKFNVASGTDIRSIEIQGFEKSGAPASICGKMSFKPSSPGIYSIIAADGDNVITISRDGSAISGDVYVFVSPNRPTAASEGIKDAPVISSDSPAYSTAGKLYFKFTNSTGQICEFTNFLSDRLRSGTVTNLGKINKFTFKDEGLYVIRGGEKWARLRQKKDIIEGSALDFSAFCHDAPAGKYGALKAVGNHFEFAGKPGEKQFFYGCNLTTTSCAPDKDHAGMLAARLSRIGYNSVRFHHYDYLWAANDVDDNGESYRDRMDYLAYKLIEKGIYITFDIHTFRNVKFSDVGLPGTGETTQKMYRFLALAVASIADDATARDKGLLGMWDDWSSFAHSILGHRNPYTGRTYAEEPAVIFVTMLNEPFLNQGWDQGAYNYEPVKYAWKKCFGSGAVDPSTVSSGSSKWKTFIRYIQANGYRNMLSFCKSEGCVGLLSTAHDKDVYDGDVSAFSNFDLHDSHCYVDHPEGDLPARTAPCVHPLQKDIPRYANVNNSDYKKLYNARPDVPHTLTEWNHCTPNPLRALGAFIGAAYLRSTNWSGIWRFAYAQGYGNLFQDTTPNTFDVSKDEVMKASEAGMVSFYLRGDVTDPASQMSLSQTEFAINTPRSIALFRDGMGLKTAGILSADTSVAQATILLTSMDGKDLASSSRMLLANITDCAGKAATYADETKQVTIAYGSGQYLRISRSDISIALSDASSFKVYELDTDGSRVCEIPATVSGGKLCFTADVRGSDGNAHLYYEITK